MHSDQLLFFHITAAMICRTRHCCCERSFKELTPTGQAQPRHDRCLAALLCPVCARQALAQLLQALLTLGCDPGGCIAPQNVVTGYRCAATGAGAAAAGAAHGGAARGDAAAQPESAALLWIERAAAAARRRRRCAPVAGS